MRTILIGLTAVLVAACAAPETQVEAGALVDAAWLNDHLDDVVVLDIRAENRATGRHGSYAAGHIPGAIPASYSQIPWRMTRDSIPGMLPRVEDLEHILGALGISNDDHVVIVSLGASAAEFGSATRIYWQFKVLGHERVSILNGGYMAWLGAGYRVETEVGMPTRTTYTANFQPQLVANREDVLAALESGTPLIDARPANYYSGQAEIGTSGRYGTIVGAKNIPYGTLTVGDGGTFVDAATARALWAEAGIPSDGEQIAFCHTGHVASLAWFAAYELLGNKQARLYDGSLAEWSADPELPLENTDGPSPH